MLVFVTTAKTSLVENVFTKYLLYYYLYAVKNPCSQNHSNQWRHCSSAAFQIRSFHRKLLRQDFVFFLIILILIHYFLRTLFGPREWLAVCGLVYLVYLFFSYLSHALIDFSKTGTTFYLMHTLQVQQFSELSCHLVLFQSILYTAE